MSLQAINPRGRVRIGCGIMGQALLQDWVAAGGGPRSGEPAGSGASEAHGAQPGPPSAKDQRQGYAGRSIIRAVVSSVMNVVGRIRAMAAFSTLTFSAPPEISTRSGVLRKVSRSTEMARVFT